ncbi:MAG: hypothetical protein C4291_12745 [Candidatus Dadabacteria bacterium]
MVSKKRFLFFMIPIIGVLLFASSLTLAEEEKGNLRGQLNPQAVNTLGEEFSVLRKVLDGLYGSDPNDLLWNRADDIIALDSSLFQKGGFEGIVPAVYFSLNQQDVLPSIKFSTIGIGLLFYLNR